MNEYFRASRGLCQCQTKVNLGLYRSNFYAGRSRHACNWLHGFERLVAEIYVFRNI